MIEIGLRPASIKYDGMELDVTPRVANVFAMFLEKQVLRVEEIAETDATAKVYISLLRRALVSTPYYIDTMHRERSYVLLKRGEELTNGIKYPRSWKFDCG